MVSLCKAELNALLPMRRAQYQEQQAELLARLGDDDGHWNWRSSPHVLAVAWLMDDPARSDMLVDMLRALDAAKRGQLARPAPSSANQMMVSG